MLFVVVGGVKGRGDGTLLGKGGTPCLPRNGQVTLQYMLTPLTAPFVLTPPADNCNLRNNLISFLRCSLNDRGWVYSLASAFRVFAMHFYPAVSMKSPNRHNHLPARVLFLSLASPHLPSLLDNARTRATSRRVSPPRPSGKSTLPSAFTTYWLNMPRC